MKNYRSILVSSILVSVLAGASGVAIAESKTEDLKAASKAVEDFKPRLVITGEDKNGKSIFTFDGTPEVRNVTPQAAMVPLWQIDKIPSKTLSDTNKDNLTKMMPPENGLRVFIVSLKPDEAIGNAEARYRASEESLRLSGQIHAARKGSLPGFHQTETVETITMISGEVYTIMETEEKLLKQGDTIVQRGTNHSWANRGSVPAIFVVTMWPATR